MLFAYLVAEKLPSVTDGPLYLKALVLTSLLHFGHAHMVIGL